MITARQLMSRISTIDRIVADIPMRDGWYLLSIFAKSPNFSIVDKMRRFELASIWSEVSFPTLVSLENMSVIICDILGNLFRVKFLAICKKKGRILTLDLRFCLCTSSLSGNKHLLFLKKRHVLFASAFVATFSSIFCHFGSMRSISSKLLTKLSITFLCATEEQVIWAAKKHKRKMQYLILINDLSVFPNARNENLTTIFTKDIFF